MNDKIKIASGQELSFTYEVIWKYEALVSFNKRFDKYLEPSFFQHKVYYNFIVFFLFFSYKY